jgi:hypothetical protein
MRTLCIKLEINQGYGSTLFSAPRLPKELCFLERFQVLPVCLSGKNNVSMKMSVEYWWNDVGREKTEVPGENLCQRHFVRLKSYMDCSGCLDVRGERPLTSRLTHGMDLEG